MKLLTKHTEYVKRQNPSGRYFHLGLGWIGDKGGGLERYQHGICSAHASLGCEVTAWVQSRTPINPGSPYPVVAFASPLESRNQKLLKLKRLARAINTDADFTLVTHHASVSNTLLGMLRDVPHVVHFHGPWADEASIEGAPWWKSFFQARVESKVYHSADKIITLSSAFRELIIQRFRVDEEKVHVIPGAINAKAADPGIPRSAARKQLGWPLDRPIVLAIRRLVRRVGVDVLVDAIGELVHSSTRFSDLLVLIGGTGPLQAQLQERIDQLGLRKNVQLLGYVPDTLLTTAYRAANLTVVPTQALEGFGLVILESLAAGTPALVTPIGSLPEVISGLSPSLVLPDAQASSICKGLHDFISGTTPLPTDASCRDYVIKHFDWSYIAPKVLSIYKQASN